MKSYIVIACAIVSNVISAPTPQDFDDEEFFNTQIFDDNLSQQGNLAPQGFTQPQTLIAQPQTIIAQPQAIITQPQTASRQTQSFTPNNNAVTVVRYKSEFNDLNYKFTYELSDGTIRSEEGAYKDGLDESGNPAKILVVQGAYSWQENGETYWTNYQSDERGYRPKTGKGVGGIKPGEDAGIDPNLLKSLLG